MFSFDELAPFVSPVVEPALFAPADLPLTEDLLTLHGLVGRDGVGVRSPGEAGVCVPLLTSAGTLLCSPVPVVH